MWKVTGESLSLVSGAEEDRYETTVLTFARSEAFSVFNSSQLTQTDNEIVLLHKKMKNSGEMKQVSDVLPEYKTDFATDHILQL